MTNREVAFENIANHLTETQAFLKRLATHLCENGMDGQAGNCTIKAGQLERALVSLEWLKSR